ncbi:MAG: adenosylhomocysteinase [Ignavibacteriae bacterium]|jgi:adenosylhomocysteinase|nr:adenosylhomocysteinase [Ignavibacteriota bacterium]
MSVETSNIPQKNEQGSFSEVPGSYCVRDISLAEEGRKLIDWAEANMPVMMHFRKEFEKTKPFAGYRLAGCLHVTKETAVLIETFKAAGAEVYWSGCNPLSTNDAVAAALAAAGISIYAWHGNHEDFYWCIDRTLDNRPHLTLDDGCDLINTVHEKMIEYAKNDVIGGTEETTTGVHRLRARSADGKLYYPVFAVNDAETKWDFDNVYGTGQSTLDGILRATSVMLAGKNFVVAGHGHCGAGVAKRASGMGSNVIITEVKATAAIKGVLEGYEVRTMDEAAKIGDIFCTATGMKDIIRKHHFESMRDGAIVCNTGHYDCEINIGELEEISVKKRTIRQNCEEYTLKNGHRIYVLAEGRLVNLAAAEGHPSEVMDMSFANQFLCHVKLVESHRAGQKLPVEVIDIPVEQDEYIAELKLKTMGLSVDILTQEQIDYATNYQEGT